MKVERSGVLEGGKKEMKWFQSSKGMNTQHNTHPRIGEEELENSLHMRDPQGK